MLSGPLEHLAVARTGLAANFGKGEHVMGRESQLYPMFLNKENMEIDMVQPSNMVIYWADTVMYGMSYTECNLPVNISVSPQYLNVIYIYM